MHILEYRAKILPDSSPSVLHKVGVGWAPDHATLNSSVWLGLSGNFLVYSWQPIYSGDIWTDEVNTCRQKPISCIVINSQPLSVCTVTTRQWWVQSTVYMTQPACQQACLSNQSINQSISLLGTKAKIHYTSSNFHPHQVGTLIRSFGFLWRHNVSGFDIIYCFLSRYCFKTLNDWAGSGLG